MHHGQATFQKNIKSINQEIYCLTNKGGIRQAYPNLGWEETGQKVRSSTS